MSHEQEYKKYLAEKKSKLHLNINFQYLICYSRVVDSKGFKEKMND